MIRTQKIGKEEIEIGILQGNSGGTTLKQWLTNEESDELGESYIKKYESIRPCDTLRVDIEGFCTDFLKLSIVYEIFAESDSGKIGFLSNGVTPLRVHRQGRDCDVVFPARTIVLSRALLRLRERGRRRFTIAHEAAHYLLERLSNRGAASFHEEFDGARSYSGEELARMLAFGENRADRLAAALLMPRFRINEAMARYADGKKLPLYGASIMLPEDRDKMRCMADALGVSYTALSIKLGQLGYIERRPIEEYIESDLEDGDFSDADIAYDRRYGTLTPEQAYFIHRSRRESERAKMRNITCPVCGFRMATVTNDAEGNPQLRCSKCKLNEPMNLAYFRTMHDYRAEPKSLSVKKSNNR